MITHIKVITCITCIIFIPYFIGYGINEIRPFDNPDIYLFWFSGVGSIIALIIVISCLLLTYFSLYNLFKPSEKDERNYREPFN